MNIQGARIGVWLPRLGPPLALLAAAIAFQTSGAADHLTLETLARRRGELAMLAAERPAAALALFALVYVAIATLALPAAAVMSAIGGFLFGAPGGALAAASSATLAGGLLFLLARGVAGPALSERAGPRLRRIIAGFRAEAASFLLFLRLAPVFPFWLVTVGAALGGARLSTLLWTTFLGVLPAVLAYALAGAGLDSLLAEAERQRALCLAAAGADCALRLTPGMLATREALAALFALSALALLPVWLRRRRRATT